MANRIIEVFLHLISIFEIILITVGSGYNIPDIGHGINALLPNSHTLLTLNNALHAP
jgi:hypothetical protein